MVRIGKHPKLSEIDAPTLFRFLVSKANVFFCNSRYFSSIFWPGVAQDKINTLNNF